MKNIYTIAKHAIWHSETVLLGTRNGPFGTMKRSVLEREMACMVNVLIIKGIEGERNWMRIMKYFEHLDGRAGIIGALDISRGPICS